MTTLSAPPVTRPPAQSGHPTGSQDGSTARRVLSGYFRLLSVPLYWQHTRLQMPMLGRLTKAVITASRAALR